MALDEKLIAELKEKADTPLTYLKLGTFEVVVKTPNKGEWRRFQDQIMEVSKRRAAVETLVRTCVVYPDAAGLDAMLDQKPAFITKLGDEIGALAGTDEVVEKKEL